MSNIALKAMCDVFVARNASGKTYNDVGSIPHRKVGLILGTSPISTWNGRRNYYFDHRIKAGAELYKTVMCYECIHIDIQLINVDMKNVMCYVINPQTVYRYSELE